MAQSNGDYSNGKGILCQHSGKVDKNKNKYETKGSISCRSHGTVWHSGEHQRTCQLGVRSNGDQCIGCAVSPNGIIGQPGEIKCLYIERSGRIVAK